MSAAPIMYAILSEEAVKASGGNRGKMAAQCGHAFVRCILGALNVRRSDYSFHEKKVVLVTTEPMLKALWMLYSLDPRGIPTALVKDAGHNILAPGTITALGIGPIYPDEIGDDIKALKAWT